MVNGGRAGVVGASTCFMNERRLVFIGNNVVLKFDFFSGSHKLHSSDN